jgi:preprotein translocase subunit Sec61beta
VRYAEEEKEVLRLKPKHVLAIVIGMIVLQVLLRLILG